MSSLVVNCQTEHDGLNRMSESAVMAIISQTGEYLLTIGFLKWFLIVIIVVSIKCYYQITLILRLTNMLLSHL